MSQPPNPVGGSNGCLLVVGGLGLLLVVAALGLESLPDEFATPESAEVVYPQNDVSPYPPTPAAPLAPPIVDPIADTIPAVPPPGAAAGSLTTLLWHVEAPGDPAVAGILRIDATSGTWNPTAVGIECADGRAVSGNASHGSLRGVQMDAGASFRAVINAVEGLDPEGNRVSLHIDTGHHRIDVGGSPTMPSHLFVEELSVPNPSVSGGLDRSSLLERRVRLAVPSMVTGAIPVSVAMVRGTGRSPRAGDSVCELSVDPTIGSGFSCRIVLRCHGEIIYGLDTTGYNDCALAEGVAIRASDTGPTSENSDPRLEMNLIAGTLTVSDDGPRGDWSASFDLIEDPRCGTDTTYRGAYRSANGPGSFIAQPFAQPQSYSVDGELRVSSVTNRRCGSGVVVLEANTDTPTRLSLGPSAQMVAGYADQGQRAVWGYANAR